LNPFFQTSCRELVIIGSIKFDVRWAKLSNKRTASLASYTWTRHYMIDATQKQASYRLVREAWSYEVLMGGLIRREK
jgi:hypothetical protein